MGWVEKRAHIVSTSLGFDDGGRFRASLRMQGTVIGEVTTGIEGEACARYVQRVMWVVGVDRWEDVAGHDVLVLRHPDSASDFVGIRSIPASGIHETFLFADAQADARVSDLTAKVVAANDEAKAARRPHFATAPEPF